MTGRAATTAALYCGFLALWALADAARRREPSPYLLLGAALLEAALLVGAVIGMTELDQAGDATVHAGYLIGSVVLLPLGLLLARDRGGHLSPAPLAVAFLALAVVILRAKATA